MTIQDTSALGAFFASNPADGAACLGDHNAAVAAQRERWRTLRSPKHTVYNRTWREANKHRWPTYNAARRLRVRSQSHGDLTPAYLRALTAAQGTLCPLCGGDLAPAELDHIVPLSRLGNHSRANVIYLCRSCNRRKGSRDPSEVFDEATMGRIREAQGVASQTLEAEELGDRCDSKA